MPLNVILPIILKNRINRERNYFKQITVGAIIQQTAPVPVVPSMLLSFESTLS